MICITYHACDACGTRLDKGTPFVGVVLRQEKVDQGYWSSDETRQAEFCHACLDMPLSTALKKFFGKAAVGQRQRPASDE